MFVVVTVFAVLVGLLSAQLKIVRDRRELVQWLRYTGGEADSSQGIATIPVWRRWLGDEAFDNVILNPDEKIPRGMNRQEFGSYFPEAKLAVWSRHPSTVAGRPPNHAKDARDKAWSEKLRAKRDARNKAKLEKSSASRESD